MTSKKTPPAAEAEAKAKADAEAKAKADAEAKAKADAAAKKKAAGKTVTVVCMARNGRRRGGRKWGEGKTEVPASEMTDELRAALESDPLFSLPAE